MLTVAEIRAIKTNEWLYDGGVRGAGTLAFKGTVGGCAAYFRYTTPSGSRYALPLGNLDLRGRDGMTLLQARAKAGELSKLYLSGVRDIRGHLEAEERTKRQAEEAQQQAQEAARAAVEARRTYTLAAMLEAYVTHLERQGKAKGAKDARSCFKVHVLESHPQIAPLPAREITPHQVALMIRTVREKGHERMAGVLRSYLQAAFALAARSAFDSAAPSGLIGFGVEANPVTAIPAIRVRAGTRTLAGAELGAYLRALGDSLVDQALRLTLLAGGQRIAQLLRARVNDFDTAAGVLRMWDPKGRRVEAREHLLPLGPKGAELVTRLIERAHQETNKRGLQDPNPPLFLSVAGATVDQDTPGKRVADIAQRLGVEAFDLRDIRRTCETQLAALGVSRDVRAQLLSHGLGGVQNVHYDRHSYINEKRVTLRVWEDHLESLMSGEPRQGNVVRLSRAG